MGGIWPLSRRAAEQHRYARCSPTGRKSGRSHRRERIQDPPGPSTLNTNSTRRLRGNDFVSQKRCCATTLDCLGVDGGFVQETRGSDSASAATASGACPTRSGARNYAPCTTRHDRAWTIQHLAVGGAQRGDRSNRPGGRPGCGNG